MHSLAHVSSSELAKHIDYTLLRPTTTWQDIDRLCAEAVKYGFWSVCVGPTYVRRAASALKGTGVKVCTVVGFPLGYDRPGVKLVETNLAIDDGADEIDMVMNMAAFKSGELDLVSAEIGEIADHCRNRGKVLKVIIECCYLTDEEKVRAALLAEKAGADYVKTSTGFGPGGAKVEDVVLLKKTLTRSKVKAAGGIGTLGKALEMIEAGADRLGTSAGVKIMEELALARGEP
jgi:deoxyribose-phosphate aldolase